VLENTGIPLSRQTANGDSGRAGQFLNGTAYGGVSHPAFGTLTVGRQISLQGGAFSAYDPQRKSNAFSLLGWSSSLAGAGITESSTPDNSVKYFYRYGPLHAAGMYAQGGEGRGFFGPVYGANVGGTYGGFSLDAVYQKVNAGVKLSAYTSTALKGRIADGESWSLQGKYSLDLDGGFKIGHTGSKLTFYAGYENISMDNSSQSRSAQYVGRTAIGGYLIGAASSSSYVSARVLQLGWAGVRYELPSGWSFAGAYYHLGQNHYQGAAPKPVPESPNQQAGNLAGSFNQGSFVADYRFNKHFDVYAGVNYSAIKGGLASGYLANKQASVVTGARLKF
jgi:predicted porin